MNEIKGFFIDNLSGFSPKIIPGFIFSFLVCALLAFLLGRFYIRFGNALSNKRAFARNFLALAITTMFIITVVKSSLALSLGLVGALSIVRFRAAIKEPEELTYLFMAIAIGLGCGAGTGLTLLTVIAFVGFITAIFFVNRYKNAHAVQNLYLTISSSQSSENRIPAIVNVLEKHCSAIKLKRSDETATSCEVSFFVEFDNFDKLQMASRELRSVDPSVTVSYMDNSRDI
jgi:uncharacterized membrane protein YhiD involved in acid resistance